MPDTLNYIELAAEIVSAYVSNNSVPASDLPTLIGDVHGAIVRVSSGAVVAAPEVAKPAVAPKKSITNDYIICLEDGRKFKSLKRHLRTQYNMSPEEYREKWGSGLRLSDGRAGLRQGPFGARQADGIGSATATPEVTIFAREADRARWKPIGSSGGAEPPPARRAMQADGLAALRRRCFFGAPCSFRIGDRAA